MPTPSPAYARLAFDDFESGGPDGGSGWLGPWQTSHLFVTRPGDAHSGDLQLDLSFSGFVHRVADLAGHKNVHLRFWARLSSLQAPGQALVAVSNDGHQWQVVKEFTLAEADGLVQAAQHRGLVLQVGHIERFNQAVRALSGESLVPRFIEAHRLAQFSPRGTDVAVVLDLMIHDIDLILWMVKSKLVSMDAVGVAVVSDSEDIANARLTFENGCVANVTASRISPKKMRKIRLFQQNAYLSLDLVSGLAEVYRLSLDRSTQDHATSLGELECGKQDRAITYEQLQAAPSDALELELGAFLESVREKATPAVTGEEAREALAVALEVVTVIGARGQEAK